MLRHPKPKSTKTTTLQRSTHRNGNQNTLIIRQKGRLSLQQQHKQPLQHTRLLHRITDHIPDPQYASKHSSFTCIDNNNNNILTKNHNRSKKSIQQRQYSNINNITNNTSHKRNNNNKKSGNINVFTANTAHTTNLTSNYHIPSLITTSSELLSLNDTTTNPLTNTNNTISTLIPSNYNTLSTIGNKNNQSSTNTTKYSHFAPTFRPKPFKFTLNNTNLTNNQIDNSIYNQSKRNYRYPETLNFENPFPTVPVKDRRNCWWHLSRDGKDLGYIEFHLFDEYANNAVRLFRNLCTGAIQVNGQALTYKNTYIHQIHPGNWISGGDLIGTMGRSMTSRLVAGIYEIDVLAMLHYRNSRPGLISFSSDAEYFGSQFRIIYDECPWLDGTHEVFGEVVKGWDIIKEIENTRVNARNQPLVPVMITECGECPY